MHSAVREYDLCAELGRDQPRSNLLIGQKFHHAEEKGIRIDVADNQMAPFIQMDCQRIQDFLLVPWIVLNDVKQTNEVGRLPGSKRQFKSALSKFKIRTFIDRKS